MPAPQPPTPSWLASPDVQIPAVLAVAVLLALGEWQCARSFRREGIGISAPAVRPPAAKAPAAAPPAVAPPAPAVGLLGEAAVERLVRKLSETPRGSPAWIAAAADDAEATRRAEQLRAILTRAGWDVRPLVRTPHRNRPGYFLFAADESPPAYVPALNDALQDAGIKTTYAVGYRAFYEESARTRPNFVGFPFTPDQTFLLVVGRAP